MDVLTSNSLCLAPLAIAFQNERVSVEQYFDILLAHVTQNGLTHTGDNPSPKSRAALTSLVTMDAVCGAFRIWTVNSAYAKLKADDVGPLKQIFLAAWEGNNIDSSMASLASSPHILQVIAAIAFRHQRAQALECFLTLAKRPPNETVFELMNLDELSREYKSLSVWNCVLRSGWIHSVLAIASSRTRSSRTAGWTSMIEHGLTTDSSDPAQLSSFLCALRNKDIVPTLSLLSSLVEKGLINADRVAVFCDVFPARRLKPPAADPNSHVSSQAQSSPNGLLRLVSLSPLPQEEKCALLEVLLRQGLDPNWIPKRYVPTQQLDFRADVDGWYQYRDERETALHVAVDRGEVDVIRLLLCSKAKTDVKDGKDRVALERLSVGSNSAKEIRDALQIGSRRSNWFNF